MSFAGLKSPAKWLYIRWIFQNNDIEMTQSPHYCPFLGVSIGFRWFPSQTGIYEKRNIQWATI